MSEQGAAKTCVVCKVDLTGKARTRDKNGKYFCTNCYEKALHAKHERQARERTVQGNAATHSASHSGLDIGIPENDESTSDVLDELTAPPPTPKPKVLDPRKCPVCEEVIAVGAVICTHCGHNLASGATLEVVLQGVAGKRVYAPHRTSTTVFAIICAVFGAGGFFINMLVMSGSNVTEGLESALADRSDFAAIISLFCNVGLLTMGVLLFLRNVLARPVTVATFAIAMVGAVWSAGGAVLNPSAEEADLFGGTLNVAGIVIRVLVIAVIAWFYWLILRHLRDPATRVEFGTK